MKTLLISIVILLSNLSIVSSAKELEPEELFVNDEVGFIRLSSDGKYLAYTVRKEKTDIVAILDIMSKKQTLALHMGENKYVGNMFWGNNTRLVIEPAKIYAGYETPFRTGDIQAVNYDGSDNTLLYSIKKDTTKAKNRAVGRFHFIQNRLKNEHEYIMLTTYDNLLSTRRLIKLNIYNGNFSLHERSSANEAFFVLNDSGEPIAQSGTLPSYDNEILYKNGKDEWTAIKHANDYTLLDVTGDGQLVMAKEKDNNSQDLILLNRLSGKENKVASVLNAEILSAIMDKQNNLIGYVIEEDIKHYVFTDENSIEAKFKKVLDKNFSGSGARVISESDDHAIKVIEIKSDQEPGKYYIFNNGRVTLFDQQIRKVDRSQFNKMQPIEFKARDGLLIKGYLTRPKGVNISSPMVVMVHGGPFGPRDSWGFNRRAQLLSSHGFSVLQINFRGSGGYGKKFEEAGYKQWGLAMQDDLTDGTLWAIKEGIADKDKICILGASYGGYAALMGAVKEPDLYQCAIGEMGVYDLPMMYKEGDIQERESGVSYIEKKIGTNLNELRKASPAFNAEKINADVLLIHGKRDRRAPIEQFESMEKGLVSAGIKHEKYILEGEEHGYFNIDNLIKVEKMKLAFLKKNIGN
ncbi:MAG: prolyl oligopeptidase family serine peptidase [Nitrospirota bacterium]|nr:prolyl oligopeptidase family serine peptidase [Nitrospirota bacterium]